MSELTGVAFKHKKLKSKRSLHTKQYPYSGLHRYTALSSLIKHGIVDVDMV